MNNNHEACSAVSAVVSENLNMMMEEEEVSDCYESLLYQRKLVEGRISGLAFQD